MADLAADRSHDPAIRLIAFDIASTQNNQVGRMQGWLSLWGLPLSTRRPRLPDGRVVLAGDAQSLINPLTGEGIFYAVLSGALAGAASGYGARAGEVHRRLLRRRSGCRYRGLHRFAGPARRCPC